MNLAHIKNITYLQILHLRLKFEATTPRVLAGEAQGNEVGLSYRKESLWLDSLSGGLLET